MNLERLLENLIPVIDDATAKRLESIEEKNQFRAPELEDITWVEVASVIQDLPINQIALILKNLSCGIVFSEDEQYEIKRSLSKNVSNIDKMIASEKVTDNDRKIARAWKEHNSSAFEKLEVSHG